ncbi:DUF4105 domain-containing protein [Vibrio sp. ABG19]|uniref:Lnb N-terminal periplasmic domain-containing protein n=1 Tax=Vibrio sp. ABG19 TaxID=2817385 RepID=UPI00249F30DB|nr:DUF4105 domain-containing protein [Vibrio sp. ABG19]WGY44752.1 DUF4105 domain-containing protein [Vibrio sp. ABG19]
MQWKRCIFILLGGLHSSLSFASVEPGPLPELNVIALSQDNYWLKLGHYLPALSGGYVSTIDSDSFFLASQGKHQPAQELQATIQALYQGPAQSRHQARCTFPARYQWLEQQQGKAPPELNCPELKKWQQAMDPEKLTLVFPTAFMNNPSSMFGHTLLRVDAKNQNQNNALVAYAINFAAEPDSADNPALYALKGLVGAYPSRFTVMPYYKKVREYNDIESRDIWEYPLNFTAEEVDRILLHLWEMEQAEFDYYFLDENCSYQLLALLQLANQNLDLVSQFPVTAIPSDTVKVLVEAGLTQPPHYRAAFGTRLNHESDLVSERIYLATRRLKEQGIYPSKAEFTESERAAILEFAYEWLNFELYDDGLERDITAKQLTQILIKRSQINRESPFPSVVRPETSPEQGHGSARVGVARNLYQQQTHSTSVEWRPAYHDMYDALDGFIPGAQINFLDTKLSLDDSGTSRLDHLNIIDVLALAPSNRVFDSLAWGLKIGFDRPDANTDSRWFVEGGAGKAWGQADGLHFYILLKGELSQGRLTGYDVIAGAGLQSGLFYSINNRQRLGLNAAWIALAGDEVDDHFSVNATWNWSVRPNFAFRASLNYQQWHQEEVSSRLRAYYYY